MVPSMRSALLAPVIVLASTIGPGIAAAQPMRPATPIERAEHEVWRVIGDGALRFGGFVDRHAVVLVPIAPLEPIVRLDVVGGVTIPDGAAPRTLWDSLALAARSQAHDGLAIAVAAVDDAPPTDSLHPEAPVEARYRMRIEDRRGSCIEVRETVRVDAGRIARLDRETRPCEPVLMADAIRRARRIATLPLSAGSLDEQWSVALAATGWADIYPDSIVFRLASVQLRSKPLDRHAETVDSISAGIALHAGRSWFFARHSRARVVGQALAAGTEWQRAGVRFTVPIDSTIKLVDAWPVFSVHVAAPKTPDNPSGLAWTYAHGPEGFFRTRARSPDQ
jgi:hypothetical protein